ncbi:MAG: hypothetical protein ACK6A4_11780, partial [Alphaproteobacteria bacterium]
IWRGVDERAVEIENDGFGMYQEPAARSEFAKLSAESQISGKNTKHFFISKWDKREACLGLRKPCFS